METAVSENLAKINNLEKQKIRMIDNIRNLQKKFDENASEKKKLEVVLTLLRINYNSVVQKLIEDIELYVDEAIMEGAGLKWATVLLRSYWTMIISKISYATC